MSKNISDIIEAYLKRIIREAEAGVIELQRNELAELFQCVPSQINYVISTRFSVEKGYVVESKRGGGGYIRIRELQFETAEPLSLIVKSIGDSVSQKEAEGLIDRLLREELITERESFLLKAAMSRDILTFAIPIRDELRARLLSHMLTALFRAGPLSDG